MITYCELFYMRKKIESTYRVVILKNLSTVKNLEKWESCGVVAHERLTEPRVTMETRGFPFF